MIDPITIIALSALSALVYILVGMIPGTDETATIAPIALALLLAGVDPLLVLAWFMACIVAFKMADSVPVALAGIPGGVMAVPQVPDAITAKKEGLADVILRKGLAASIIGTIVATVLVLAVSGPLMPVGDFLKVKDVVLGVEVPRWFWILFLGTVILAVTSQNPALALLTIPAFALVIQGLRGVYGKTVFISFFLGITIGPLLMELFSVLNKKLRKEYERSGKMRIRIAKTKEIPLNPFKHLTKEEAGHAGVWAAITSVLATFMSPVGLTILIGDLLKKTKKDPVEGALLAYSVRDAIKNATYIGGTLIPLLVLGVPTGPMSAGPALPFFLQINGQVPAEYLLQTYDYMTIAGVVLLSVLVGGLLAYTILTKYSRKLTLFVFRKVPAEALYGIFIAIVLLLSYHDAGIAGIFGMLAVSILAGTLWKLGVSLGVLFMTLVMAPILVSFFGL